MSDQKAVGEVILKNVRASYAYLFEPREDENDEGVKKRKYRCTFMIPKGAEGKANMAAIKAASGEAKRKVWGENEAKWPKLKADRVCLRDGDEEDKPEYEGHYIITASVGENRPPALVLNRRGGDKRWLPASPGQIYSGCYVNAVIRLWAQDNKYGKRVNASLESVQFFRDGEPFGAAPVDPNDKFSDDMAGSEGSFGDDDDDDLM
jgi:hypothetical protein